MKDKIIAAIHEITDGDDSFIKELSAAFVTNFEEFKSSIVESAESRDQSKYRSIVHKVKPSFLTIGLEKEFERVDEFGTDLESRTDQEVKDFKTWAAQLSEEVLVVLKGIC